MVVVRLPVLELGSELMGNSDAAEKDGDEASLAVEHDDRLEAVFVVVGVEKPQLLPARLHVSAAAARRVQRALARKWRGMPGAAQRLPRPSQQALPVRIAHHRPQGSATRLYLGQP